MAESMPIIPKVKSWWESYQADRREADRIRREEMAAIREERRKAYWEARRRAEVEEAKKRGEADAQRRRGPNLGERGMRMADYLAGTSKKNKKWDELFE